MNTFFLLQAENDEKTVHFGSPPTRPVPGFSSTRAVLPLQHAPHTPQEARVSLRINEDIVDTPKWWKERTWDSFFAQQNLVLDFV